MPVGFMGLLVLIKSVCDQQDSPPVAYYCGQAQGFNHSYTTTIDLDPRHPDITLNNFLSSPMAQCLQQPPSCSVPNYYRSPLPIPYDLDNATTAQLPSLYTEYGYTTTASSSFYPVYGVTVADPSPLYDEIKMMIDFLNPPGSDYISFSNPSLPLTTIINSYLLNEAMVVVCPKHADDVSLNTTASDFYHHLLLTASTAAASTTNPAVRFFQDEKALEDYVRGEGYEEKRKVGMAVVFNSVDSEEFRWDYTIRGNFTQNFEMKQTSIGE